MSLTAISIDSTNMIGRSRSDEGRLMHVWSSSIPRARDRRFLVPLPHYRRMEKELDKRSAEEQQRSSRGTSGS